MLYNKSVSINKGVSATVVLYIMIQCTWGILQTGAGFVLFLILGKRKHFFHRGAIVTEWKYSVSLGMFVFVGLKNNELLRHEYAHTIQSLILGPLYLFIIGIPSFAWAAFFKKYRKLNNIKYRSFYTEKWADSIAGSFRY